MPFGAEFLDAASREFNIQSLNTDFELVRGYIDKAVAECAKRNPNVKAKDIEVYLHGSYANKTNIYFPSTIEVVVELKCLISREYKLVNNYFIDIELDFSPLDFRSLFTECLMEFVGDKAHETDKAIRFEAIGDVKHNVDILPCISFNYISESGKQHSGILLYDDSIGTNIASFPKLHAQNGNTKDIATKGNFKRCVRLFKTLHALNAREFDFVDPGVASGYFIECLLFNVPNRLFFGDDMLSVFDKVFNYLLNCELDGFSCQNMVWELFGSAAEFWKKSSAEQFLHSIFHLWAVFPPSRTFLA